MEFSMRVHSTATHPVEVEVNYNGEKARAMLPQFVVELLSEDGHGSLALNFRSAADIAAAKALYTQGDYVSLTASRASPASISTEAEPVT